MTKQPKGHKLNKFIFNSGVGLVLLSLIYGLTNNKRSQERSQEQSPERSQKPLFRKIDRLEKETGHIISCIRVTDWFTKEKFRKVTDKDHIIKQLKSTCSDLFLDNLIDNLKKQKDEVMKRGGLKVNFHGTPETKSYDFLLDFGTRKKRTSKLRFKRKSKRTKKRRSLK